MFEKEAQVPDAPRSKLTRDFYTRSNVVEVARELLGKLLVFPAADGARVSGMIVECEAYRGPKDRASHAYGGRRTIRTETMYGIGGTAYVYFVYGMYYQFNVVTNVPDVPHAILIRALEPVEGVEWMRRRRGGLGSLLLSGLGKPERCVVTWESGFRAENRQAGIEAGGLYRHNKPLRNKISGENRRA